MGTYYYRRIILKEYMGLFKRIAKWQAKKAKEAMDAFDEEFDK